MSARTKPVSVNFHIWPKCNLKCKFCYAGFPETRAQMPAMDAMRVISALAAAGTEKITFVGGEPTLHAQLPELIQHAKALGLTTCIVSNGGKLLHVLDRSPR